MTATSASLFFHPLEGFTTIMLGVLYHPDVTHVRLYSTLPRPIYVFPPAFIFLAHLLFFLAHVSCVEMYTQGFLDSAETVHGGLSTLPTGSGRGDR